jgi:glycosyltransferase involved in cell wall biosynthesis
MKVFSSTIIPTVGRYTLNQAVLSVLDQEFPAGDFEVIVVNDSGEYLPEEEWQRSEQVQVINTYRRERSVARNAGAAIARGKFLHFLDDDDWLLPGALNSFRQLALSSTAAWLYGSSQLVDRQGARLIRLQHKLNGNVFTKVMSGEWIPLQSSLISSDAFFAVGGFNHQVVPREDVDLTRRIALHYDFAGMDALISCIGMGAESSSSTYSSAPDNSRLGREVALDDPGALRRLADSADSAEWRGRIVRIFLTSMLWNFQNRRPFSALNRAFQGVWGFFLAGRDLFSPAFWQSISRSYQSNTFTRGFQEARASGIKLEDQNTVHRETPAEEGK